MKKIHLSLFLCAVFLVGGSVQRVQLHLNATQSTPANTDRVVAAANAFLATLNSAERAKVSFDFNSSQKTSGWSNLPSGVFQRNGLRLGDLSSQQKDAALALVASALS